MANMTFSEIKGLLVIMQSTGKSVRLHLADNLALYATGIENQAMESFSSRLCNNQ